VRGSATLGAKKAPRLGAYGSGGELPRQHKGGRPITAQVFDTTMRWEDAARLAQMPVTCPPTEKRAPPLDQAARLREAAKGEPVVAWRAHNLRQNKRPRPPGGRP
jgi:hypothetical protein